MDTPLGDPPSIDAEADLLVALLDELGIDRVGVHCWSGGGPSAYRLAVRYPERVRSLVAFAAVSESYPTPRLKFIDRLLLQTRPGNKLLSYLAAKQPEQFVTGVLSSEGSLSKPMLKERVAHVMANPEKRDFVVGLGLTAEQTAERRIGYDNDIRAVQRHHDARAGADHRADTGGPRDGGLRRALLPRGVRRGADPRCRAALARHRYAPGVLHAPGLRQGPASCDRGPRRLTPPRLILGRARRTGSAER